MDKNLSARVGRRVCFLNPLAGHDLSDCYELYNSEFGAELGPSLFLRLLVRELDFQSSKSHATLNRAVSASLSGSSHRFSVSRHSLFFSLLLIAFVLTMASRLQQIHKHFSDATIMAGGRS
jgi:hypothetical protein